MKRKGQDYLLWSFCLIVLGLGIVGTYTNKAMYAAYFGALSPWVAFPISLIAFLAGLFFIRNKGWQFVNRDLTFKVLMYSFGISMLLGLMPVMIDLWRTFPPDINVDFPEALVFYPSIGFVAEIAFHMVPVLALIYFFDLFSVKRNTTLIIIMAGLIEPIFHVLGGNEGQSLDIRDALVAAEVFVFSLFQLILFKRYGFLAMYVARLGFYLTWHIIWGYFRLAIL